MGHVFFLSCFYFGLKPVEPGTPIGRPTIVDIVHKFLPIIRKRNKILKQIY